MHTKVKKLTDFFPTPEVKRCKTVHFYSINTKILLFFQFHNMWKRFVNKNTLIKLRQFSCDSVS